MVESIKQAIEATGLTYIRALNPQDLNETVTGLGVTELGVLTGLIEIDADFKEETYQAVELWDFEIMFLSLSPSMDARGEAIDAALDSLYQKAHEFLSIFQETLPSGYFLENYSLNSTDSVNITTEVLIGWTLSLQAPKAVNICPA